MMRDHRAQKFAVTDASLLPERGGSEDLKVGQFYGVVVGNRPKSAAIIVM